jgi:PAS domain S-box-containing protein
MRHDSTLEVKRLLNELLNDRYREIPLEQVNDQEERELVRTINSLYHQRQASMSVYQDNLKRSEQRLREIIETTPVGICITNSEGIYEYVNKPYCRLYQYEPEELLGAHFTKVVPAHDRTRLTNLHEEFMGRRWELRGEWSVLRKDGQEINILADAAYIVDVDGRPKKVTFVVDITDRKRAEEQLREMVERLNQEIEERKRVERIKQEVERLIQHDLRNPLNGILNAAELLLRDNPTESQRELLVMIKESGNKLNTMISSSMDLVRMEEGTYELELQQINVADLLRAVDAQIKSALLNSEWVRWHADSVSGS